MFNKLSILALALAIVQCQSYGYGSVELPIHSNQQVFRYDVHSTGYSHPTNVEVGSSHAPINVHLKIQSSPIHVSQSHYGAAGSHYASYSQDEPHHLTHTIQKPIYQEVHEIVVPRRKIVQVVKPVHEEIQTHVAKHAGHGYGHKESYDHREQYKPKKSYGHKKSYADYKDSHGYGHKMESYGFQDKHY